MNSETETRMPTYAELSRVTSALMLQRGEWCGFPMPIPNLRLSVEPRNPWRADVAALEAAMTQKLADDEKEDYRVVNSWFSRRDRCEVYVVELPDGKRRAIYAHHRNQTRLRASIFGLMDASQAWSIDVELKAISTLETLIAPHLMELYALTGLFLETSPRSNLTYIFRRLAPTLVLSPHNPKTPNEMTLLAALCLHPIGFYENTHAGAMVPTDDVIAHLLLMRADEPMFWRRANQHAPSSPLAGFVF